MLRTLDIRVEQDHLLSLTKASGESALAELVWNCLDADSKTILIKVYESSLGIDVIEILGQAL